MTKHFAAFIFGLWLWGAVTSSSFAESDLQRQSLRGLPGVWVVVEQLSPDLEQAGLTQDQVQTDTEEKLRKAGVKVLTQEECWQTPGMPWLYITAALLKASDATYATTIGASLNQEVTLTRNPQIKTFGVTWDAGVYLGAVGRESLPSVREHVGRLIDKFIAGYQAVNQKGTYD
jgi:hypothetical protein